MLDKNGLPMHQFPPSAFSAFPASAFAAAAAANVGSIEHARAVWDARLNQHHAAAMAAAVAAQHQSSAAAAASPK
jgi:hypothetical protein